MTDQTEETQDPTQDPEPLEESSLTPDTSESVGASEPSGDELSPSSTVALAEEAPTGNGTPDSHPDSAFFRSEDLNADPRGDTSPDFMRDPQGEEGFSLSRDDFDAMLVEFQSGIQEVREGEIVRAKVLRVADTAVILEFGFKSEGSVPRDEFKDASALEPGQEVEVLLESLEDDDGVVVLSKKKADFLRVWEKIKEAHEDGTPVKGTLVRKIKGGVTVDLMGVDAFLPGSQIALRRVPNIEDLIGEIYDFMIIKLNKRRRNIVVSRRVILEAERGKKRETLVKELLVGQVRSGIVKNITDFGAFIDLGGLDGLLHITDMSWGRVGHPSEVVNIAADLDVKVLDIDWDRERISLGLKQLLPYPWTDIDLKYPVGSRVHGKVVSITNYGAFVELEKGVEGLVHISEMSWTRNVRHPSKLVSISDDIEAVVLKVDPGDEKISLGMKQIEEDPWLGLPIKYPTGTKLAGKVRNLTSFRCVRGNRARHRRAGARFGHELDEASRASFRDRAKGSGHRGHGPRRRCREQADIAGHQANPRRSLASAHGPVRPWSGVQGPRHSSPGKGRRGRSRGRRRGIRASVAQQRGGSRVPRGILPPQ